MYYVYAFIRAEDSEHGKAGSPYYIGKGHGNRAFNKKRSGIRPPSRERIQIIAGNLTEGEAFKEEARLISFYGRIDTGTGCLRNRTDGGEGVTGAHWKRGSFSPDHLAKLSEAKRGMPGHPQTQETRSKIAAALSGVSHSPDRVAKMSISKKGWRASPATEFKPGHTIPEEVRRRWSEARKGHKPNHNGMLGKKHTAESKAKMSERLTQAWIRRKQEASKCAIS